jgi:hypothetical protein
VILEDFAARPHSSGANVQMQGEPSSKTLENTKNQEFQEQNSPITQENAAQAAINLILLTKWKTTNQSHRHRFW